MALLEDMFKGNAATGLAIGLGTMILAPTLFPAMGRILRPAAKAVIKGGMVLYRQTASEIGERTSDLVAEVRAELDEESRSGAEAGEHHAAAKTPARTEGRGEKH